MKARRAHRILAGLFVPAAAGLVLLYERLGGQGLICPFYELTGLYCPGCGSGRAFYALFHGRFLEALRYNYLLDLLFLPALIVFLHEYLRFVFPRLGLKPVSVPRGAAIAVTVLIFAFWILRNLPGLSFLAPGN